MRCSYLRLRERTAEFFFLQIISFPAVLYVLIRWFCFVFVGGRRDVYQYLCRLLLLLKWFGFRVVTELVLLFRSIFVDCGVFVAIIIVLLLCHSFYCIVLCRISCHDIDIDGPKDT